MFDPDVSSWNNYFATDVDTSPEGGGIHVGMLWCPGQRVMMVGGGDSNRAFKHGPLPTGVFWHFACAIDGADALYLAVQESSSLDPVREFLYRF